MNKGKNVETQKRISNRKESKHAMQNFLTYLLHQKLSSENCGKKLKAQRFKDPTRR